MRTSKSIQIILTLTLVFCVSNLKAAEESCEVYGQYVAYKSGSAAKIGVCRSGIGGGLSYANNPFDAEDLARVLKVNKNNSAFIGALNAVGVGSDYNSALKAVVDYGGALTITGELSDLKNLEYITGQMNRAEGVTEKIEAKRKQSETEKEEQLARSNTPVSMDMAKFKEVTAENKSIAGRLTEDKCRSMSNSPEKKLQAMRVAFADGEESLVLPFEGKMIDANTYEFLSPSVGKGIGGMQFTKSQSKARQIKFQNGKTYWIADGKEYEVKTFYKSTSKEALGFSRPLNSTASYDTCFYAEALNGSAKNSNPVKSGGVD